MNLDNRDIGDEGLARIGTMTQLRSLDVFSARVTDAGAHSIAALVSLTSLELCGGRVSNRGLECLCSSLTALTSLNLSQNMYVLLLLLLLLLLFAALFDVK